MPVVVEHVDRCLSCLACQTTCPSGVDYMHLVDHAAGPDRGPWRPPAFRAPASRTPRVGAPQPRSVPVGAFDGRCGETALTVAARPIARDGSARTRDRVRRWGPRYGAAPIESPERPQIALLVGCVQSVLDADVHDATVRVLEHLGARVVRVPDLGCCGAVQQHLGITRPRSDEPGRRPCPRTPPRPPDRHREYRFWLRDSARGHGAPAAQRRHRGGGCSRLGPRVRRARGRRSVGVTRGRLRDPAPTGGLPRGVQPPARPAGSRAAEATARATRPHHRRACRALRLLRVCGDVQRPTAGTRGTGRRSQGVCAARDQSRRHRCRERGLRSADRTACGGARSASGCSSSTRRCDRQPSRSPGHLASAFAM